MSILDGTASLDNVGTTLTYVIFIYSLTYLFTSILPGKYVTGYVLNTQGKPTQYNLNGLQVLLATVTLYSALVRYTTIPSSSSSSSSFFLFSYIQSPSWLIFSDNYLLSALCACGLGLLLSFLFYYRGISLLRQGLIDRRFRCPTIDTLPKNFTTVTTPLGSTTSTVSSSVGSPPTQRGRSPNRRLSTASQQAQQRTGSSQQPTASSSSLSTPKPVKNGANSSSSSSSSCNQDTTEFDNRGTLMHFWCGLSEFNPITFGNVDIKMWLYIIGAVQLQINLLSMVTSHVLTRTNLLADSPSGSSTGLSLPSWIVKFLGIDLLFMKTDCCTAAASAVNTVTPSVDYTISYAMAAYAFCLTFFLVEYLYQEEVHTYTYDIFRERIGFKLMWGCLCFYPFAYSIGGLPLVNEPLNDISLPYAIGGMVLYFTGWIFTRGANLQKFACKTGRTNFFFGIIQMETVPGSDGRLICSGFWGLSRHINYFGEILQAIALAWIPYLATGSYVPWIYPLYYLALFIPRQIDDDRMCAQKYGHVWTSYVQKVPYRIVPYVY